ncbi:MAG: YfcE family phosphodiesterase [Ruminococcaceae bacterium]|nr:YfcE family phosphodiesterase [Oscillospiraceae bacterium]
MRILVMSDSHRNINVIKNILDKHSDIKTVFFLGDNADDAESVASSYPRHTFYIVSGNCDIGSWTKSRNIVSINGIRIYYCHGHNLGVKYTTENLINTAIENNCKIALFGHTHKAHCSYHDGIYLFNPGSCALSREGKNSYGIIDISKSVIMPNIMTIN